MSSEVKIPSLYPLVENILYTHIHSYIYVTYISLHFMQIADLSLEIEVLNEVDETLNPEDVQKRKKMSVVLKQVGVVA